MKKFISFVLVLVMVMSLSVTAFAEGEQSGTTTLTANIPNAAETSYTLHIPSDTTITYGNTDMQLISGRLYVSDVQMQDAKTVFFTARYTDLINTADSGDTIPLTLFGTMPTWYPDDRDPVDPGTGYVADELWYIYSVRSGGTVWDVPIEFRAQVSDWSGATPGAAYQSVITFTVWAE